MSKRRTLKELTLKDNFMFGAVMCDENNCRRLLELILQIPIERIEVCKEKNSRVCAAGETKQGNGGTLYDLT